MQKANGLIDEKDNFSKRRIVHKLKMLMLYCKNVIYNDEVSANIFIFSNGELCDAVLEAEEQKNVVSFRGLFVGS